MGSGIPIEHNLLIKMEGMTSSKAPKISRNTATVYSPSAKPLYTSDDNSARLSVVDLALRKPNCEDGISEWCSAHHESLARMRRSKSFNIHEARAMGRNLPGVDFGMKKTRNWLQLSGSTESLRKSLKTDRRARRTLTVNGDSRKEDFLKRCEAGKHLCSAELGQKDFVKSCSLFKTSVSDEQEGVGLSCLCRNLLTWFQIREIEEATKFAWLKERRSCWRACFLARTAAS
ncbi:uncharacterized protein LOC107264857 isoform X2 [Cephus cinctus]|uniref:Uncharacterized protein LOC107264857 isoform X2 n=1 Tax=Cephus cinctus TaxID=211228 RepID=A0AAJ7RBH1_CEPCN|nr:uncharacterized protein LOC107264857 isoform X2 [Cephus cinctus]